jgi:hypothetical protein
MNLKDFTDGANSVTCVSASLCAAAIPQGHDVQDVLTSDHLFSITCPGAGPESAPPDGTDYIDGCQTFRLAGNYDVTATFSG